KFIFPNGHGIDVALDRNPPPRTRDRIDYHYGGIVSGFQDANFIWYGNWVNPWSTQDGAILTDLVANYCAGPAPYAGIVRAYSDESGRSPNGCYFVANQVVDQYSHGTTLSDLDVLDIVNQQLASGGLPLDSFGVYIVITSPDVAESS